MSVKFKIADWKFEMDWKGMTAEPPTELGKDGELSDRRSKNQRRSRNAIDALKKKVKGSQEPAEQGEKEAWT
jgi:hypothetical protein